jgi:cell division protein FtsQ
MNWKKQLIQVLWLLAGIGTIVLFGAAMQQKNRKTCAGVKVEITGVEEHLFIDENDVLAIVNSKSLVSSEATSKIDLKAIEVALEATPWVKNAELFFDNKQVLQIKIVERQPVARVFTAEGTSFYVDSAGLRLPLSEKLSARVPMFTNFPSDRPLLAKPDSLLLESVVTLGKYIIADSFWMAQTAQVAITPQATFEIIPTIGNQIIVFGTAEDFEKKFERLHTFYQKAWLQNGINTYEKLDVQYNNQVVAVKRGTAQILVDSAKANAMLHMPMDGTMPLLKDSSMAVATIVKVDSAKLKKQAILLNDKKKLVNNKIKNNKKKTNPLSIVNKPVIAKPKAEMRKRSSN